MNCTEHKNEEYAHCPSCLAKYWEMQYQQAHRSGWEQCKRAAADIARAHNKCPSNMSEFIARNIAAMTYKEQ